MSDFSIDTTTLACILPMHMLIGRDGHIRSCGPTLRKVIGPGNFLPDLFLFDYSDENPPLSEVLRTLSHGGRVFLRAKHDNRILIRGHGCQTSGKEIFANFGFGSDLISAIYKFNLKDTDFSVSDLAMEVLFLSESTMLAQRQLSRFNELLLNQKNHLEHLSNTDSLTGLLNRRGMERTLSEILRDPLREDYAFIYFDLDNFKAVNDYLGHAAGDSTLKNFSRIISSNLGPNSVCFRIGGDEFAALKKLDSSQEELSNAIHKIIKETSNIDNERRNCGLSASAGVSFLRRTSNSSVERVIEDADFALYQAKSKGKSKLQFSPLEK